MSKGNELKRQLEERGIRLNAVDLAAAIEGVSPKSSRMALSYALDLLRPFAAGMGFRIARLSDAQIEIMVPHRKRNLNEAQSLHEAALIAASTEAIKILWQRHAPLGAFEVFIEGLSFTQHRYCYGDARIRIELAEPTRETVLASLRQRGQAESDSEVRIYDENDQAIAEINLKLKFKHTPALGAPEE